MIRRLMVLLLLMLALPARADDGLDVGALLAERGTRLLVIEFYATWCKPCMAAMPRWKRLKETFAAQGLRIAVVNSRDPTSAAQQCRSLPFSPDASLCDLEGTMAQWLGVGDTLPAAFLWSWQGNLLVQKGHIDEVEREVERYLRKAPRVVVEAGPQVPELVVAAVKNALSHDGKVMVTQDADEQRALDAAKRRLAEASARYDERQQCQPGQELPPNALLRIDRVTGDKAAYLTLTMKDLETGCHILGATTDWNTVATTMAEDVVAKLLRQLRRDRVQMPGGGSLEKRRPDIVPFAKRTDEAGAELRVGDLEEAVVKFDSTPPAAVFLGSKMLCKQTPCRKSVPLGPQTVSMSAEDYVTKTETVTIARSTGEMHWTLTGDFASLTVNCPSSLPIELDGVAETCPLEVPRLSVGRHKVALRSPCHLGSEEAFEARRGDAKVVTFEGKPRLAALTVRAREDGSENDLTGMVRLDGVELGAVPGNFKVPVCGKTLEVRAPEGGEWIGTVQLSEGKRTEVMAVVSSGLSTADEALHCGNHAIARWHYERACANGAARACLEAARFMYTGLGGVVDKGKAATQARAHAATVEAACASGSTTDCVAAGLRYAVGVGAAKDEARAVEFYRKACDGGNIAGCGLLAGMYEYGIGVAKDMALAVDLDRKACDGGYLRSCSVLGYLYFAGQGVPKDHLRAVEFFRKACDGGDASGCQNLGGMYQDGTGVAKDEARAVELYRKACDGGEAGGCHNLGLMYEVGTGVMKNPARTAELFRKACDGAIAVSCFRLGRMHSQGLGVAKNESLAAELYRVACDGGCAESCSDLGAIYVLGTGVTKNEARAVDLYRKACDGGDAFGCYALGGAYNQGASVHRDPIRARTLWRKACDAGEERACAELGK